MIHRYHFIHMHTCIRPKWAKSQGKVYRSAQFVLIGWQQDDDLPLFGKITDLLRIQDVPILIVTQHETLGIDRHYHSYLLKLTHLKRVVPVNDLDQSHPPVNGQLLSSGLYVSLHSFVLNTT